MNTRLITVTATVALWTGLTISSEHTGNANVQVLPDINPDPNIVEVNLVASPAQHSFDITTNPFGCAPTSSPKTTVWTYNGVLPGPQIEAEIGQTVVVNFTNMLPDQTTIHWHGLEVPANMDGSQIAQLAVPPNGSFRYEFKVLRAATYWYHPHIRTNKQVERGLAGTLVVRDPAEDRQYGLPSEYTTLVLDDILTDEQGKIKEPFPANPLEKAQMQLNGREGNLLLVNGKDYPTFQVYANEPQRFRIVNVSNTRFFRLSIPGHQIHQIGSDGGLLEQTVSYSPIDQVPNPLDPTTTISNPNPDVGLMLTPGERADVLVVPQGQAGDSIELEWHDFHRGKHSVSYDVDNSMVIGHNDVDGTLAPQPLMRMRLLEKPTPSNLTVPTTLRKINPIPTNGAPLAVVLGHSQPDAVGDVTFFARTTQKLIDGVTQTVVLPFDQLTAADALTVTVGENRVWEVENRTGADHPFHSHGWFFQPIETIEKDESGKVISTVPWPRLENKDTVRIPARPGLFGSSTTIRMAVLFDDVGREGLVVASGKVPTSTSSGGWLYHCHVLEHTDRGMMAFFNVAY